MRNGYKLVLIGITLISLTLAGGCDTVPSATPLPGGGLEGIVSDVNTGAPIVGAQVNVAGQVGVFTLTTDKGGRYQAHDLPAGSYLVSVQATGYYVGTSQVGVASGAVSQGNVALEPDALAAPSPAPTASLQPTYTPLPTYTPWPTYTPLAAASLSASATETPEPPPSPTASPTAAPTPGSLPPRPAPPRGHHTAPILLEPEDESVFVGPRRIIFRWTGVCCLAQDEYFVISITHPWGVEEAWLKGMSWKSPDYLYLLVPESGRLPWNVTVRRHTGEHPNGQWKGPIVSPVSQTWHIVWHVIEGPESPLAPPVSPLAPPTP